MPATQVVLYRDAKGRTPFLSWFASLPHHAQNKCRLRLERLGELGHELRRPEADYLRDGIYELRASARGVHYRILYFFLARTAAVVSHGIIKERGVPAMEIDDAVRRKLEFSSDPERFTHEEG